MSNYVWIGPDKKYIYWYNDTADAGEILKNYEGEKIGQKVHLFDKHFATIEPRDSAITGYPEGVYGTEKYSEPGGFLKSPKGFVWEDRPNFKLGPRAVTYFKKTTKPSSEENKKYLRSIYKEYSKVKRSKRMRSKKGKIFRRKPHIRKNKKRKVTRKR